MYVIIQYINFNSICIARRIAMKVCWNITSKCNLNCKHCFREKQEHDLPLEQNLRIIDNIANIVDEISFSGGEVLLYDCFDQVLQKANDLGIPCTFTTTANSLKTVDYNKYLKYIESISLSLDYVSNDKNEQFNRGYNYFKTLQKVVKEIKSLYPNIKIVINTVCMQPNLYDFNEIYNAISKLQIDAWKILRFTALRGNSVANKNYLEISNKQFEYIKQQATQYKDIPIIIKDSDELVNQLIITQSGNLCMYEDYKPIVLLTDLQNRSRELIQSKLLNYEETNINCNNINLNLYKTFYDVAKAGSISGASKNTYISQPAISKAIKRMEQELGVKLFLRTPTGVELTKNGKKMLYYIETAYNNLLMAKRIIKEDENCRFGSISIGVPSHIATFFMLEQIKKFHKAYPNIVISIISRSSKELMELLKAHVIDFIIDTSPVSLDDNSLVVHKLTEVQHCFFTLANDNVEVTQLEQLRNKFVILPVSHSTHRKMLNVVLDAQNVKLNNIMSIENSETIIQAVRSGMGIGYVLKNLIADDIKNGVFKILDVNTELPKVSINLIYMNNYLSVVPKKYINEYILNIIEP